MNARMKRRVILWMALALSISMFVTILVPSLLGRKNSEEPPLPSPAVSRQADHLQADPVSSPPIIVPVYLSGENKVDRIQLEDYVRGVVAAEMPAEFEPEALKAQALAARTYIVRRWLAGDRSNVPVQEAIVTDTITHQAYQTDEKLRERWGDQDYETYYDKLEEAVQETEGLILTYENEPIEASFFSTSNGRTENSEDYWEQSIPYLRSVDSPWDKEIAPKYKETINLTKTQIVRALGISSSLSAESLVSGLTIMEYSEGGRIKSLKVGGQLFTGKEVREKLQLNSSQFQWRADGSNVEITTFGYGHGVGMSQWGANGMAKEGRKAEEIVKHYYTGIEIQPWSQIANIAN